MARGRGIGWNLRGGRRLRIRVHIRAAREAQIASTRAGLAPALLLQLTIAGVVWGAMNLACILFFSYAPPLMAARGYSPTTAASLTSLAIWFTILAIPSGGYLVHRIGRPIAGDRRLRLDRGDDAGGVRLRRSSGAGMPDVRRCRRPAVGRHPVASCEDLAAAATLTRLWRVLHLLLCPDGGRAAGRRPFAGRLGIALGRTGRGCGIAWRDSALVSCPS